MNGTENNSTVKRIEIPNRFVSSPKRKERNEIEIIPPKICLICGKKDVDGKFKIHSTRKRNKFITVLMCREHKELAKKAQNPRFLYLTCIISILLLMFAAFLDLFINFYIFPLMLLIMTIFCMIGFYKGCKGASYINKYINFKYFKTSSIILIKSLEWANEFQILNQFNEHKLDLGLINEFKKKRKRTLIHLGIMAITCIIGILISSILYNISLLSYLIFEIIVKTFIYLLMGAIMFFVVIKIGYYTMKILALED